MSFNFYSKFKRVNIKMNEDVLKKIDDGVAGIKSVSKNFQISRSTLIHILLMNAIQDDNAIIKLDGVEYKLSELLEVKDSGKSK